MESALNQVGKDKPPSTYLLQENPFLEDLGEVMEKQEPLTLELFIARIQWDWLSEVPQFFSTEQVFAYTLKLLVLHPWSTRIETSGKQAFQFITSNITESLKLEKEAS
jgi:hypothetical protein